MGRESEVEEEISSSSSSSLLHACMERSESRDGKISVAREGRREGEGELWEARDGKISIARMR